MQQLTADPRADLTEDQVRELLTGAELEVAAGLELLDQRNRVVADISDDLAGGSVAHNGRASVHGTCKLQVQQRLSWGRDRVRPYLVLSNAAVSARFNLGVYVLTTPVDQRGEDPVTFDVDGYDLLQPLGDVVGDTYVVEPAPGEDIAGGTFETDAAGWESNSAFGAYAVASFARSNTRADTGAWSLEVTWPDSTAPGRPSQSWVNRNFSDLVVGKTYLITARVWVPEDGPDRFRLDVVFHANAPWVVPPKGQWTTLQLLWTATTADAFPGVAAQGTTAGTKTWIDNVTMTPLATTYLDAVRAALTFAVGAEAQVRLDGTEHVAVLPAPMVWALTDSSPATWLQVVNDLLASINYRDLWVDENGTYRSEPFLSPSVQPVEWTFDTADEDTNIVGEDRQIVEDVWGVPNWWRFVRRGMTSTPVEGEGIYTVTNLNRGPASRESLGRVVRRVAFLDAADQAALVAQGDRAVLEQTSVTRTITLKVDPLPIVGHLDVVQLLDAPSSDKAVVVSSETQLDGSPGTWVLEVVS